MYHFPKPARPVMALAGLLLTTAVVGSAAPAFAKGGVEGAPAPCTPIVVTNSGKIVKNRVNPPDMKLTVTACGSQPLDGVVTITEGQGFFSTTCAAPVAEPISVALPAGGKVATSAPAYRGPCGWYSQTSSVFLDGYAAWQSHTMILTLSDRSTGAVLGRSSYTWRDDKPGV